MQISKISNVQTHFTKLHANPDHNHDLNNNVTKEKNKNAVRISMAAISAASDDEDIYLATEEGSKANRYVAKIYNEAGEVLAQREFDRDEIVEGIYYPQITPARAFRNLACDIMSHYIMK